jgi:replicative DNA helicase
MDTRQPPHNVEAEQSVLGAVMIDQDRLRDVQAILATTDFYREAHGTIYGAMIAAAEHGPVDFVTLADALERRGQLEAVGGAAYLARLMQVPSGLHAEHYARLVKRDAHLRGLIHLATRLVSDAYAAGPTESPAETIIADAMSRLTAMMGDTAGDDSVLLGPDTVDYLQRQMAAWAEQETLGVHRPRWPWQNIARMVPSLYEGELAVIAAESSVGKTVAAECCAEYWARFEHRRVAIFHGELNHSRMLLRRLSRHSGVPMYELQRGRMPEDARKAHASIAQWAGRITYVNSAGRPMDWIVAKAESLLAKGIAEIFVVDYLQIVPDGAGWGRLNVEQTTARKMALFKDFVSRRNVYGLVLSQVNRSEEGDNIKSSKSLRDSGQLFEKANLVLFFHRPFFKARGQDEANNWVEAGQRSNMATVQVAKHTNGSTGATNLLFRPETLQFVDLDVRVDALN